MVSILLKNLSSVRAGIVILICVLFALGIFSRIWQFGALPLSLNRDEASIAYNAWTIAREGVDEWGVSYPFMFRAFGDYKLPGYIYVSAALFTLFEPTELLVRLPSLLAGLANIVLMMLIVRRLMPQYTIVALAAGAALAVSPWAVFYSRVAFEAHLALTLTLGALWLLLGGVKTYWQAAAIALLLWLAGLTYNAPLLLTPVILGSYTLFFYKTVWKFKGTTAFLMAAVIALSMLTVSAQYQSYVRKNNTTVFFDQTHAHAFMKARSEAVGFMEWLATNRYTYYSTLVLRQYAETIGPPFIFWNAEGHPWHTFSDEGYLTHLQYYGAIIGLVLWAFSKKKNPAIACVVLILIATPLPSAITVDAPHATRSLTFFALSIIPFAYLLHVLMERKHNWMILVLLVILLIEGVRYSLIYQTQFPQQHSPSLQVGLAAAIKQVPESADSVIVREAGSGYVYVALYERISAQHFQSTVEYGIPDIMGYDTVEGLGRYTFTHDSEVVEPNAFTIARSSDGVFELREN